MSDDLIDVSPDMGMYRLLISQNYGVVYALAEFIDNSIQAFLDTKSEKKLLDVKIYIYSTEYKNSNIKRNSIIIEDNGHGISPERIAHAFKPAKYNKIGGLSEFGIGMKSAAVWFANSWSVNTTPYKSEYTYSINFDLDSLLREGSSTVKLEKSLATKGSHGTVVKLNNIRKGISEAQFKSICSDLTEFYQKFTKNNILKLQAFYDDSPCSLNFTGKEPVPLDAPIYKTYKSNLYAIGEEKKWELPINFEFIDHNSNKTPVKGFLKILEKGSYKNNPGIVLLRYNRVIKGFCKEPYIPEKIFSSSNKYARQRIYGNLHMDGVPVTYTKDNFDINEEHFLSLLKEQPGVDELLNQANNYRATGTPKKISNEEFNKLANKADSTRKDTTETKKPEAGKPAPPPEPTAISILSSWSTKTAFDAFLKNECINSYNNQLYTAASLCLRVVLEHSLQYKIQSLNPTLYKNNKVADMTIWTLLTTIDKNKESFLLDEFKAKKCIQSIISSTTNSIVLINNIAHGHFNPSKDEFNKLVLNIAPIIDLVSR